MLLEDCVFVRTLFVKKLFVRREDCVFVGRAVYLLSVRLSYTNMTQAKQLPTNTVALLLYEAASLTMLLLRKAASLAYVAPQSSFDICSSAVLLIHKAASLIFVALVLLLQKTASLTFVALQCCFSQSSFFDICSSAVLLLKKRSFFSICS